MATTRSRTGKLLLLGEASVGKTSLRSRYVRHSFSSAYRATINSDFLTTKVTVGGEQVVLQVWDTAGQERFNSIGFSFYRGADVAILVFDLTKGATFNALNKWVELVYQHAGQIKIVIAGNKSDLKEYSVVSERQVSELADQIGALYFDVSAKENLNVDTMFQQCAQLALEAERVPMRFESVEIDSPRPNKASSSSSCC